jgi:hypothetical protein
MARIRPGPTRVSSTTKTGFDAKVGFAGIETLTDRPLCSTHNPARNFRCEKHNIAERCRGASEPSLTA